MMIEKNDLLKNKASILREEPDLREILKSNELAKSIRVNRSYFTL